MHILEGFICDKLEHNLSEKFIIDMTERKINIIIEIKTFIQTSNKKCSNSIYGGCIRKDIEESYKCVT